jgi:hypothetical protein
MLTLLTYADIRETVVRQGAPCIGGLPIELRLDDNKLETLKVETVK